MKERKLLWNSMHKQVKSTYVELLREYVLILIEDVVKK